MMVRLRRNVSAKLYRLLVVEERSRTDEARQFFGGFFIAKTHISDIINILQRRSDD
jgi:hypothetical protein